MSKKWWFIIGGIVVLLLMLLFFGGDGSESSSKKVTTAKVQKHDITEIVEASGKIQPETEVRISADVSGQVIELHVKEGDQVKKGDLLCKINPDNATSALNRSDAAVLQARANLANSRARLAQVKAQFMLSEANFKRSEKLKQQGAISDQEFETAKSNFEVAKAEVLAAEESVNGSVYSVRSAEATRKEAADNLGRTSIYAPMDGTISQLSVEKGEMVVGTAQMEGTHIMTVARLDVMEAEVDVNESIIIRVKLNDPAMIEVDAYPNRKFEGVVTEIASTAASTLTGDQVTSFPVKIRILASSYADLVDTANGILSPFRPGMSATVEIETETVNQVLAVPVEAVTSREDTTENAPTKADRMADEENTAKKRSNKSFICVFVVEGREAALRVVETGIQDTEFIHITDGLKEGEEVITGDFRTVSKELMNGTRIKVIEEKYENR